MGGGCGLEVLEAGVWGQRGLGSWGPGDYSGGAGGSPAGGDPTSEEAAVFEVLLDDDVGDGVEDELDVLRVGGARHVGVDLLDVATHVEFQELHLDVVARVLVGVGPCGERAGLTPSPAKGPGRRPEAAPPRAAHRRSLGSRC